MVAKFVNFNNSDPEDCERIVISSFGEISRLFPDEIETSRNSLFSKATFGCEGGGNATKSRPC
jgi:hypothetical protein